MLYNPAMHAEPNAPLISVIIPNCDRADCLRICLRSLMQQTYPNFEVLVVDNASRDASVEMVRQEAPHATILPQRLNMGFAAAVNKGLQSARGEWIAVLNNDTEAAPDWLAECCAAIARHPDASFLTCRILDYHKRSSIFSAGDCFLRAGIGYRRGQEQADGEEYDREIPIFSACGCAALYRKTAMAANGGYDESFFAYLEDVDLGLRLQAGAARGYYAPRARIFHLGGATSGGEFAPLAVRLRTRNAILLLLKSVPGRALRRSLPMILTAQVFWFGRVLSRGRLFSYLRGLAGVIPLVPVMLKRRRDLRAFWRDSGESLWQSILESEDLARHDYLLRAPGASLFLSWYFRLF